MIETTISEGDVTISKIKLHFEHLKQKEDKDDEAGVSEPLAGAEKPSLLRSKETIKRSLVENDRILKRLLTAELIPVLINDSVFKTLVTDSCSFFQKARPNVG